MKRIVEFFVHQPIFGDLLSIFVIIIGIGSAVLIRREVFPNISFDVIQVSTVYTGATPEQVEKLITNPIEQDLKEVDGIKRLTSVSVDNLSNIYLVLDPNQTTGKKAKDDAQAVVDQVTDLPDEAKKTIVKELESKQQPIIEITLGSEKISRLDLRDVAKKLEKELEKVSGVAKVSLRGLQNKEIRIEVSLKKMSAYRLTFDEISNALKKQNVTIPGGIIEADSEEEGALEKSVQVVGDFQNEADILNMVVRSNELGQVIKVKDFATVHYSLAKESIQNFVNGKPAISLTVLKKQSADAITVVEKVKERVDIFKDNLLKETQISYINDNSEYVKRRLGILTGNLGLGLLLVVLMLPLMLPWRFALIIALGEPFAFLGALIVLYLIGGSLNLISMLGLIMVSGILVDDSIVVTENAVRLIEEGKSPKEAGVEGTMQIMAPVTASVLTTTFAFLPMAFMSGVFGKFVREIPIAVIVCLAVSLFETLFILPGHVAHWIKAKKDEAKQDSKNLYVRFTNYAQGLWDNVAVPNYLKFLEISLKKRYHMAVGLIVLLIVSIFVATKVMKVVLFPPEGVEIFFIRTDAPTGTGLNQHATLLKPIEQTLQQLPKEDLKDFVTTIGIQQQDPNDPTTRRGSEFAQIAVYLTPENFRERTATEIIEELRLKIGRPTGINKITFNRLNPGPPQGKPVSLSVRGENYDEINLVVSELKKYLEKLDGVSDVTDSYIKGREELRIITKQIDASAAMVSTAQIGSTVRAAFDGIVPTSIRTVDEKIDLRLLLNPEGQKNKKSLENLFINNNLGQLVPLSQVAEIKTNRSLSVYEHEANYRQVKVTAEIDVKKISAMEANNKVRELLPQLKIKYPKIDINFGGEDEDTQESLASLGRAFLVAVMCIFLMLVLTFKKLLQPLLILITIPLGVISVIWAFFFHGMPFSFLGMLGIVALSGIIVNNAIVFVDFVNDARAKGMDNRQSILEAGSKRLRPIFLTTVTTIVGVIPTAYGIGGLDKFVVPIAMALGWGLMFGSILTSFIFPSALAILDDVSDFLNRKLPNFSKLYSDH